jgi:predicted SnoaL-like aldol condensation-catalyzing enzyme
MQQLFRSLLAVGVAILLVVGVQPGAASDLEQQNKEAVMRIYDEVLNQDNTDAAGELFSDDLVQHDPGFGGGPAGQLALFQALKGDTPGLVGTVKHIAADGDLVAVHWQASATPDDEFTGRAVVDLWRMADGKAAEHWNVFQPVPPQSASGNSMFSDVFTYPPGGMPQITDAQRQANKQMVVSAYMQLFNEKKFELLDQLWDPRYYQHNPCCGNGPAVLRGFLGTLPSGAGPIVTISHAVADQDLVFTIADRPADAILADLFRVVNGKIIEHWDVVPAQ